MKRSEEIETLANRLSARAASLLFPDQPELRRDMGIAALRLREYAAEVRAREQAQSRDTGRELAVLLARGGPLRPVSG